MLVAKTKALISFAVIVKLICIIVFACMQIVGFVMQRHRLYNHSGEVD